MHKKITKLLSLMLVLSMVLAVMPVLPVTTAVADDTVALWSATASSTQDDFVPANAIDGDTTTRWQATANDGEWIYVDLGGNYSISQVELMWEAAYATSYTIETSLDGASWTSVSSVTSDGGTDNIYFSITGRYVRISALTRSDGKYGISLYEIKVYGTTVQMGTSTEITYMAISNAVASSGTAGLAVDGDSATYWQGNQNDGEWIYVDLGGISKVDGLFIEWEAAYASVYNVDISTDGANWETMHTEYSDGNTDSYAFSDAVARYIRIDCTDRSGKYGTAIYEIKVCGTRLSFGNVNPVSAVGSTTDGSNTAELAIDNNTSTRWSSQSKDYQWFYVDLGDEYVIDYLDISWETAYASEYIVALSDDGTVWRDAATINSDGGNDRVDIYYGTARYVRISCVTRASKYGISFYEFTVNGAKSRELVAEGLTNVGGWTFARVPDVADNGETISTVGYSSSWTDAIVPGTTLYSYYMAGVIADPYYGDNMAQLSQDYYNVDYWYRTELTVPADYLGDRVYLNFDGINWCAEVYVNGINMGVIEGPFTRGVFDITDYVTPGQTAAIAVKIIWSASTPQDSPCFICLDSWDFMPAIPGRDTGIYKDVYLTSTGSVEMKDTFVKTDLPLPSTDYAELTVSTELTNTTGTKVSGTLTGTLTPGNITFSKDITVGANTTTTITLTSAECTALHLDDPALWWPTKMGAQSLYDLELSFTVNGAVSDVDEVTFGVREYEYDTETVGDDLKLKINGEPVFLQGVNWGMPDALLSWTDEEYFTAVEMHADMGMNMIRTWHGTSDFDEFYEACDEYGILVFEDFWLNGYYIFEFALSEKNQEMFVANSEDKFRRLRNHASIALWCAENETYPPDYCYDPMVEQYNRLDGTRKLIPVSNQDSVSGGTNYGVETPSWYFSKASGLVTELGSVCIPTYESLKKMLPESSLSVSAVGDYYWQIHDFDTDIGNKNLGGYTSAITDRYGSTNDMKTYAYRAQLLNYEISRGIYESFNDKMWNGTSGVLYWMGQSVWPSTIWQMYDSYFEATGSYYGTKDGSEPVHIQLNPIDYSVKAINTTLHNYDGATAKYTVYNLNGSVYKSQSTSLNVAENAATKATNVFNNIAAGKNVTASDTFESNYASQVTDSDTLTRWASYGTDSGKWITVDLGATTYIGGVSILWEAAYANGYKIQLSDDGTNFTDAYTTTSGNGDNDTIVINRNARYVRVYMTSAGNSWGYSLYEIRVWSEDISSLSELHFIKLELYDDGGELLSDNFYFDTLGGTDYTALSTLSNASLSGSVSRVTAKHETTVTVTVTNTSSTPAVGIRIMARDNNGESILPAIYSDNYFTLMAGESKTITVNYDNDTYANIYAMGYNLNEVKIG